MFEADIFNARIGYCNKCKKSRPPRTHHCSICDRCILRMDHHCPWVGNCIGFFNHKYFIQFLIYTSVDLLIIGISSAIKAYNNEERDLIVLVCAFAGCAIFLSTFCLSAFHIWLILTNQSTLELQSKYFNIFDTGIKLENFRQIFGDDLMSVFLPIPSRNILNGVYFPVRMRKKTGGLEYYEDKIFI